MNRKKQSSQVEDKTQEKQSSSYSPILKSGILNKKYRSQHGTSVELPAIPEVSSSDEISSIDEETGSKTNITKEHSKSSMLWTLYHNIIDSTIPLESQDIDNEQDRERILKSLLTRILFSVPIHATEYPPGWLEEEGSFHTLGVVNSSPDAIFSHISFFIQFFLMDPLFIYATSGCIDLVIARKGMSKGYLGSDLGTCIDDSILALQYVVGNEFSSKNMDYFKV